MPHLLQSSLLCLNTLFSCNFISSVALEQQVESLVSILASYYLLPTWVALLEQEPVTLLAF